jgi:modulator of FtsH protease HflK
MSWGSKGSGQGGPWGNRPTGPGKSGGSGGSGGNQDPSAELEALIRRSQDSLKNALGGGSGDGSTGAMVAVFAVLGLVLWGGSGIYRVDPDELGVVSRFGKYERTTYPGLNYHLPYPIETVITPSVTTINREEIGFRSAGGYNKGDARQSVPEESLMLTGDKNIVSAQFEVQWRVNDAGKYLFNLRSPDQMVRPVAETVMREVMGNTPLSLALSDKRQAIAEKTRSQMQEIMEKYETGIEVFEVNLLAVDAPDPVVDAFIDVLAAQQEKETLRNQALKYRDGIIPVAQGQVEKLVKEAEGYKEAVVSKASGDAARFTSVYTAYTQAKDVTRRRMYLEMMTDIMPGMNKIVVDEKAGRGSAMPYFPLNDLKEKQMKTAVTESKKEEKVE